MNPILNFPTTRPGGPAAGLTFGTFTVGDSNREAFLAARSAADGSGRSGALLILCGSSDTGKTHLLNAIHAELLAQKPASVIMHLNADDFTGCLIRAIHTGTTVQFRSKCQHADALLLDDVHFFAGKERTREELSLILEARCRSGRCSVITLDCASEGSADIENDLRIRFPDAALVTITEPSAQIRAEIVRAKAAELSLPLSEEDIGLIVQHTPGTLRNIHGILNRIRFYRDFPEAFPNAPTVAEIVRSLDD